MQTTGAHDDRTTSAASKRCLRSCMPAVVRPCCCTELTCKSQGRTTTGKAEPPCLDTRKDDVAARPIYHYQYWSPRLTGELADDVRISLRPTWLWKLSAAFHGARDRQSHL